MRRTTDLVVVGLGVLLAACSGEPAASGSGSSSAAVAAGDRGDHGRRRGRDVTVMTRNLYVGVDLFRIAAAQTPLEVAAVAAAMWRTAQETDFPSRAELIAEEIDEANPDLVALEEAYLFRTGPGTTCDPSVPDAPATQVAYDFLALLEDALARRGLHYDRVVTSELFDGQLCAYDGTAPPLDVRITDRDAILVHRSLRTASPRSGVFAARAGLPAGGGLIPVPRGWSAVNAKARGTWFQFAMTHLETEAAPAVQEAQAAELAGVVAGGISPVILAGDFNAGPELAGVTTTYADLLGAGFRDPWTRLNRRDPGPTCCFDELLRTGSLTQRVDLTLSRGHVEPKASWRTGLEDLTRTGMHPSDHAGVVTIFEIEGRGED